MSAYATLSPVGQEALKSGLEPSIRTMAEFAEDEIVLVSGIHADKPYRVRRKPSVQLWFDALDEAICQHGEARDYLRFTYTGPNQFGKSLEAFSIPILYFLFEMRENVICGTPTGDMADAKWNEDLVPFIMASRYADMMPTRGAGSKGA